MAKTLPKRFALAQHFLHCPRLVRRLVQESTIAPTDTVVEIGAGDGMITEALAEVAKRVIAVEKDPRLVTRLRERFHHQRHVEVIAGDFLTSGIKLTGCTVFANIPFNQTAAIMRKLADAPVRNAYLVMQRDAVQKFAGQPVESLASVLLKPHFELDIFCRLRRTDFDPPPGVEVVMLRIKQRDPPLLTPTEAGRYRRFVTHGFRRGKRHLRLTYQPVLTPTQWKRLARDLHFPWNATPTQLSFAQWWGLFSWFQEHIPVERQGLFY
jgi:23S rRNA (adenine-N6)-dimethyltransferase